jgi:hypothetical protein
LITCPHCSAPNVDGSQFCESCGKALPAPGTGGPRVVSGKQFAGSEAGRALQLEQLDKQARSARNIMLGLGILQVLLGALIGALAFNSTDPSITSLKVVAAIVGMIGIIYIGLGIWARTSPFPASIVGLTLYVSFFIVDIIADPANAARDIIIKIIIIAALAKAVSAGAKHRQLKKHMELAGPTPA